VSRLYIRLATNNTTKIRARNLAMPAKSAARPPNPKTDAITAMIKKVITQLSIKTPIGLMKGLYRYITIPDLRFAIGRGFRK